MAKKMTPAQRRQHYDAWRVSGMSRTAYARQHGINHKTFWHLCRAFVSVNRPPYVAIKPVLVT
ncbi:IS66 family insertion sequence element accessory protein TnpA [Escherichia coli]|uniref:IS66 family insertion sequence element accessory protein TnpA n=1 Tax=Escherichia coli TaxID=562 RepID=UPI002FF2E03B